MGAEPWRMLVCGELDLGRRAAADSRRVNKGGALGASFLPVPLVNEASPKLDDKEA